MSDYLTTSEQHRLACGTCRKRLRDHNEQSDHAFVRMTTPPRTPTTATLGHRDVCTVDVPAAWHEKWPCLPDERHTFPPSATHCFCGALRRPPVDVVEVTLFTPAEARAPLDVERLARALPKVMTQEECDEVYAVGTNPLDVPYEWFTTPRELATDILSALEEPTR